MQSQERLQPVSEEREKSHKDAGHRLTGSQAGGMQGAVKAPAHPDTESESSPNVDAKPSRMDEGSHITMLERLSMKMLNSLGSPEDLGGIRPQRSNVSLPSRGSVQSQCRLLWGFKFLIKL